MQSDKNGRDKLDQFSRIVGEKLRDHEMPVESDLWDALEKRLPRRERRVFPFIPWVLGGVAAAVVLLLLLLNPLVDEQALSPLLSVEETPVKPVQELELADAAPSTEAVPQALIEPRATVQRLASAPVQVRKPAALEEVHQATATLTRQSINGTGQGKEEADQAMATLTREEAEEGLLVEASQHAEEGADEGSLIPGELLAEEVAIAVDQPEEEPRSWMLAVTSGGGLSGASLGGDSRNDYLYDSFFPGNGMQNDIEGDLGTGYSLLKPGDYTEIEHRPPLTFSLIASFPVNERLTFDTGLSYTYLYSRFSRDDQYVYRASLQQHYIGVPVNMRYRLWHNDAWSVYLFGGGSIEKGLRSIYKQDIENNGNTVFHTRAHHSIKGFQLSAQGGAGFSHRLNNNLHLFAEPRLIYYFNNNQPMSARTENPLVFSLNVGMRFQFDK